MAINIRIPAPLQKLTENQEEVQANGTNVKELIDDLETNFPGIKASFNDYGNHYLSMGNTNNPDGKASIELFKGTHKFKAYKDHTYDTGDLTNDYPGTEEIIVFQTSLAIGFSKRL